MNTQADDTPSSPGLKLANVKGVRPGACEIEVDAMPLPPALRLANVKGVRPGSKKLHKIYNKKIRPW